MVDSEDVWLTPEGEAYTKRNKLDPKGRTPFLKSVLPIGVTSILECGPNGGVNMEAIHSFAPYINLSAIEVNPYAYEECKKKGYVEVFQGNFLTHTTAITYDLVMTAGVLVHLHKDHLAQAWNQLYNLARKYILIVEYFDREERLVQWRDSFYYHRDYGGLLWEAKPDLKLVNYGFLWKKVSNWDNVNWWLFAKPGAEPTANS